MYLSADDLINICLKDDVLLYRAIESLTKMRRWNAGNHSRIMKSLHSYIVEKDKLSEKQIALARKIIISYGPALKELHDAKIARKERKAQQEQQPTTAAAA